MVHLPFLLSFHLSSHFTFLLPSFSLAALPSFPFHILFPFFPSLPFPSSLLSSLPPLLLQCTLSLPSNLPSEPDIILPSLSLVLSSSHVLLRSLPLHLSFVFLSSFLSLLFLYDNFLPFILLSFHNDVSVLHFCSLVLSSLRAPILSLFPHSYSFPSFFSFPFSCHDNLPSSSLLSRTFSLTSLPFQTRPFHPSLPTTLFIPPFPPSPRPSSSLRTHRHYNHTLLIKQVLGGFCGCECV